MRQEDGVGPLVQTHARTEPLGLRHELPGLVPAAGVLGDERQLCEDVRRSIRRAKSRPGEGRPA